MGTYRHHLACQHRVRESDFCPDSLEMSWSLTTEPFYPGGLGL